MANNNLNVRIQQKIDTESNWNTNNPILLKGEIAISSDKNGMFKVGDGTNKWSSLNYNKVNWSNVEGKPSTLANPQTLTIQLNGGSTEGNNKFTYNGSSAKNINVTPTSIGASPTNHTHTIKDVSELQSTLNGKQDKNVYSGNGGSNGLGGFIAFAKMKVLKTYVNTPIEFKLVQRSSSTPCLLSVVFKNSSGTDPDINKLQYIGDNYDIFAHKVEESTWVLYCRKIEKYDWLVVLETNIFNERCIEITYPDTYIETKPSSNVVNAVLGYNVGRAESSMTATKLTTPRYINGMSFDGTKDINIGLEGHSCYVGNVSEPMYHRILSTNKLSTDHQDYTITLYIQQPYRGGYLGIVNISLRTNGAGQESIADIKWLVRCGFELDQICFNLNNTNGNTYIDVFYKSRGPYQTMHWYVLAENNRLDTYNNKLYIKNNTTTEEENQNVYTLEEMKVLREYTNKLVKGYDGTVVHRAGCSDKLITARAINGTAFNGTSNITTANWGASRIIKIGNSGKSVNGSSDINWSLEEIGAAEKNHTHSYVNLSGGTMTGQLVTPSIELKYNAPYIDFHCENSSLDYTTRIIEEKTGCMAIKRNSSLSTTEPLFKVNGNVQATNHIIGNHTNRLTSSAGISEVGVKNAIDFKLSNWYTSSSKQFRFALSKTRNKADGVNYSNDDQDENVLLSYNNTDSTLTTYQNFKSTQNMYAKVFSTSGADFAEFFEWSDKNINGEDRCGLFVTLEKDKIRVAKSEDTYILGVVSANPTVCGNGDNLEWNSKYLKDEFGRLLTKKVKKIVTEIDENGKAINVLKEKEEYILNKDFDKEKKYIPRQNRKEWEKVALVGQLVVIDDGTCEVNGFCGVAEGGIATKSESGYRVIKRIDENHIKIILM